MKNQIYNEIVNYMNGDNIQAMTNGIMQPVISTKREGYGLHSSMNFT